MFSGIETRQTENEDLSEEERNEGTIVSQARSESRDTAIITKIGKSIDRETLNRAHEEDENEEMPVVQSANPDLFATEEPRQTF